MRYGAEVCWEQGWRGEKEERRREEGNVTGGEEEGRRRTRKTERERDRQLVAAPVMGLGSTSMKDRKSNRKIWRESETGREGKTERVFSFLMIVLPAMHFSCIII